MKKQNNSLQERLHTLTHEHEDGEVRRSEVENQLKSHQVVSFIVVLNLFSLVMNDRIQMLSQHQESEAGALERIQKLQDEKRILQERITGLQRAIAQLDAEKRETERNAVRLEKDRSALKKTLDKVYYFFVNKT